MPKEFASFNEVITDNFFIENVHLKLMESIKVRNERPRPKPGLKYTRDWYDAMSKVGMLNTRGILDNIVKVWEHKSSLPSIIRNAVEIIGNQALVKTFADYEERENLQKVVIGKVNELQTKPQVRKPRAKKVKEDGKD